MAEQYRDFAMRQYDCINRRDLDGFLEGISEDVEFRSLIAESEGETFHGHDGVRAWWGQVVELLGGLDYDLADYTEKGDGAVVKLRVRAHMGTTDVEQVMWQAVVIRDGLTIWWEPFRSEEEAWAALRERLG